MVPVVIYLSERLVRALRSRIETVKILKVEFINFCLLKYSSLTRIYLYYSTGWSVTRETLIASYVKTRQLQIQKRTIHVSQMF